VTRLSRRAAIAQSPFARPAPLQEQLAAAYAGAYWPLRIDGRDLSANARHMTVTGGVTFDGRRATFDGTTGYLQRAAETWALGSAFTIRARVMARLSGATTMYILGGPNPSSFPSLRRGGNGVNRISAWNLNPALQAAENANDNVVPGVEHDVVFVQNGAGAGQHIIYINGVATPLTADAATAFANASFIHYIGARAAAGFWDGPMADVGWCAGAIAAAVVQQHIDAANVDLFGQPRHLDRLTAAPFPLSLPHVFHPIPGDTSSQDITVAGEDVRVVMPGAALDTNGSIGGLKIKGARNVEIISGEIKIDTPVANFGSAWDSKLRALYFEDCFGVLHVEGMHMHGATISEGIQVFNPTEPRLPTPHFQCNRIDDIKAPGGDSTKNHSDLIQIGGCDSALIDRFTGSSDYQGISFIPANGRTLGPGLVRRCIVQGIDRSVVGQGHYYWQDNAQIEVTYDRCYVIPPASRTTLGDNVWPSVFDADTANRAAVQDAVTRALSWPAASGITGTIQGGPPPGGDWAIAGGSRGKPGIGYTTPGYLS
jgi:hypothetical protein